MGSVSGIGKPPPLPPYGSNNQSSSDDPALTSLVDAAWEAQLAYQAHPSDANIMALMDRVNQINAYFKNYKDPKDGSNASKLYETLNAPPTYPATETFAQMCAHYPQDSDAVANIVKGLEGPGGSALLNPLFMAFNRFGSVTKDKNQADVKNDIDYLNDDLAEYKRLMSEKNPDPKMVQDVLARIAELCPKLKADCQAAGVTDGYLTGLLTLLNTPTGVGGQSLMSLTTASPPDLNAIQNALKGLGENGQGGDLSSFLATTEQHEYGV